MTLATRCSACGTSFRVVQDQLKVSGGWVRCGRCGEVFNAIEGLYEVGSPMAEPVLTGSRPSAVSAPVPASAPSAPPPAPAVYEATVATAQDGSTSTDRMPGLDRQPRMFDEPAQGVVVVPSDATPQDERHAVVDAAPVSELPPWPEDVAPNGAESALQIPEDLQAAVDEPVPETARWPAVDATVESTASALPPEPEPELEREFDTVAATETEPEPEPAASEDEPASAWGSIEQTPSFVLKADRAVRWQRPGVQRALAAIMLLLIGSLGLQAAVAYRDTLAARWPATQAPLAQACQAIGCRIEPPRHIAAMSVESSGLQQVGTLAVYQLSVVLRNRGDMALMAPALELVLSDSQGATVARKVLTLADLGRPDLAIPAGAEWSGQALLDLGGRRVSGYTIEIFYP